MKPASVRSNEELGRLLIEMESVKEQTISLRRDSFRSTQRARGGIGKIASLFSVLLLLPGLSCGVGSIASISSTPPVSTAPVIQSITVTEDVARYPFFGDLWANTWADDDRVYFSFGDGTGATAAPTVDGENPGAFVTPWPGATQPSPGCFHIPPAPPATTDPLWGLFCRTFDCSTATACYPISHFTDSGLVTLSGSVPNFDSCPSAGCLVATDLPGTPIPPGLSRSDDKVSSLLYFGGKLYYAGHDPSVTPYEGYVAVSSDKGKTWSKVPGTPWTGSSPFRVLMFINMGQNYQLNSDGYVYAMGTPLELERTFTVPQFVYLARIPAGSIADYIKYQYLTAVGTDGTASWSSAVSGAIPLVGLSTLATGSAMYHGGTGQYLFLAGVSTSASVPDPHGTLFAAPKPWGPWTKVGEIPGIHISMLITKGAGPTSVFFTAAGGTDSYNLNIGRIDMKLSP
jgi:hypothetical protein